MKMFPAICIVLYLFLLEAPIVECRSIWTSNTADVSDVAVTVARHLLQSAIDDSVHFGMLACVKPHAVETIFQHMYDIALGIAPFDGTFLVASVDPGQSAARQRDMSHLPETMVPPYTRSTIFVFISQ